MPTTDANDPEERRHAEKIAMEEKRHREDMDALTVKVLVALNGGGSIALLTFSSNVMGNEGLRDAAFCGILVLILGLLSAVLFNIFRRKCSLAYQDGSAAHGTPCVCHLSHACRALSVALFAVGAGWVPVVQLFLEQVP